MEQEKIKRRSIFKNSGEKLEEFQLLLLDLGISFSVEKESEKFSYVTYYSTKYEEDLIYELFFDESEDETMTNKKRAKMFNNDKRALIFIEVLNDLHIDNEFIKIGKTITVKYCCDDYTENDICIRFDKAVEDYENKQIEQTRSLLSIGKYYPGFDIKKVIFNFPATIVFWKDGSKTVVKKSDFDVWDIEKGLAMALLKHYMGEKQYKKVFKKYITEKDMNNPPKYDEKLYSFKEISDILDNLSKKQ